MVTFKRISFSKKKDEGPKRVDRKIHFYSNIGIGKEKDYFIDNLAMFLGAGMDLIPALDAMREELRSKRMKNAVDIIKEDMGEGVSLWKSIESTRLLPRYAISLVKIGEETGRLSENLKVIVVHQQKERSFRSKLRSAMMYPILILFLTLSVGIGIAWFLLPRLSLVFEQLRLDLPAFTKMVLGLGRFLGAYGIIAIPLFLSSIGLIMFFLFIFPKTKFIGQMIFISIPVVKKLVKDVELSRFGYVLGNLLSVGLPVVSALDSLQDITTYKPYQKFYLHLRTAVEEGNSFQKSFNLYKKTDKLIPTPIQQVIISAEQSGRLSDTLMKVGVSYEEKTEDSLKNLTVMLEPILLVIVWGGVVGVAMAVILPLYNLIGGLNS